MTDKKPSLEEFAEADSAARFEENAEIKRELNAVRASYASLQADHARLSAEHEALERALAEARVLTPQPGWLRPAKRSKADDHHATLVAMLSDIHGGERVVADEMQGYNAYDLAICEARLKRYFEKAIMLSRDYIAGVKFDGLVLALGGDQSSGTIHDELAETNELSTFETVLWLAPRIVSGLEMWAEEYEAVHVVSVPGNHGRDSKAPRFKGRSAHNADTMLAKMVAYYFGSANRSSNVTFDIPDAFDAEFRVYETTFALEHGDNLRFSGVSEIGALGPVKRGTLRKSRQHQQEGRRMDVNLVGHFHQYVPASSQGFLMNGSVKGYDEYARGWHLTPEPPQQALMVVTPEHGVTQHVAIRVSDRDAEGW